MDMMSNPKRDAVYLVISFIWRRVPCVEKVMLAKHQTSLDQGLMVTELYTTKSVHQTKMVMYV